MATEHSIYHWMAAVLREVREDAGLSQKQIAYHVGTDQSTISLFERGELPRVNVDQYLAGYGKAANVAPEDRIQLLSASVARWQENGKGPLTVAEEEGQEDERPVNVVDYFPDALKTTAKKLRPEAAAADSRPTRSKPPRKASPRKR